MKHRLLLLFIISILSINVGFAAAKPAQDTIYVDKSASNELTAYKLLAETAEKSYENQKETTHWFLGIIATFLVSVIISQVILNTRFNTRLIKDLQSNFEKTIAQQKLSFNQEIQSSIDDARTEINLGIENQLNRVYANIETATATSDLQLESYKKEQKKITLKTSSTIKINEGKVLISDTKYVLAIGKFISAGEDLIGAEEDVYNALEYVETCLNELTEIPVGKLKSVRKFLELAKESSKDDASNIGTIHNIEKKLKTLKTYKMIKGVVTYL